VKSPRPSARPQPEPTRTEMQKNKPPKLGTRMAHIHAGFKSAQVGWAGARILRLRSPRPSPWELGGMARRKPRTW
jgi:hypothetical protein